MGDPVTHVAMFTSPGIGHITPMLELAKCLVAVHDLRVSFYAITSGASVAQTQLLHSLPISEALKIIELPPVDVVDLISPDTPPVTRIFIFVRESLPALRAHLLQESPRPTILVTDLFTVDSFRIADELHMPKYMYFPSNAWLLALSMYSPTLDRVIPGEYCQLTEPIWLPGCKPIQIGDLVPPMMDRKAEDYAWYLFLSRQYPKADGILLNTCEDIEPTSLKALREDPTLIELPTPRVHPVGPLIKTVEPLSSNQHCLSWLDLQPLGSVLFVSFGSGGTLSTQQTIELALGLELSRQRFLWVVRPPNEDTSAAFFTSGGDTINPSEYLPEGFLERTKGTGMVTPSWAPQIEILRHNSLGGFLTHGGWNSVMESIVHGVPMVVWPLYAEQMMNASMLSDDLKVAFQVRPKGGLVKREAVETVVRLLMEGEEGIAIKKCVEQLRSRVMKALAEGGSSYDTLARVVDEWKCLSFRSSPK